MTLTLHLTWMSIFTGIGILVVAGVVLYFVIGFIGLWLYSHL